MDFLAMALITHGRGMDHRQDGTDFMPNVRMAIGAFDFMIRDMILMHELRGILRGQQLRFVMALDALPFRNVAIPLNDVDMAPLTDHPPGNILPVIEIPPFDFNISFGLDMTGGASPYRTRNTLFFAFLASLVVVTDETVNLVNREMGSLNQLGMTGCTAKFHSPSQLPQMFPMREGHILIDHVSLEVFNLMASLLEATCIVNLCMGSAWPFSRDKIGKRYLAIHPFPLEMI
jgi:hypothetical protein